MSGPSIPLSPNARVVLERRYLRRDDHGALIETPAEMFRRVADSVAAAERGDGTDPAPFADAIFGLMTRLEFLPNSPTLMNAGLEAPQLAACFVLPVEDSLSGIFGALRDAALIHQSGGGTGFTFSHLRPAHDVVRRTHGIASGPVSFLELFDVATDAIKQGGARRGANMAILDVDHPDIETFIHAKTSGAALANFNLSVAVPDAFMEAVERGGEVELVNPRTGQAVATRPAVGLFEQIVDAAWATGDPGLVFMDRINADNPTPHLGRIESTNPCGEQPLLPNEACTLGSIDLARFVRDGDLDWERLDEAITLAVRFLDDVVDATEYPTPDIARVTRRTRKIGLGVMGFADLLIALRLPYDSEAALEWADRVARFLRERADAASAALAEARGVFPAWAGSIWDPEGPRYRNATRTTIAPTGTLSMIASCSSGIEPLYALAYVRRHYLDPDDPTRLTELTDVHHPLRRIAEQEGWWSDDLLHHLLQGETLQRWPHVPDWARTVFVTAHQVAPSWHVRMQAAFQRHIDNAVSKTINFPATASRTAIADAFLLAWHEGCKGITAYRDTSHADQVLTTHASST